MSSSRNYTIDTSKPVLVTGATGYIAGVLIRDLLQEGLTVHATVRDPSQKDKLRYLQDVADQSPGQIKFFRADLLDHGSFAEAMKDCAIVFHTASPYTNSVDVDPYLDLIEPAVKGTINVLNEANYAPSVKRIVLTGSSSAIANDATDTFRTRDGVLTEEHWNRTSTTTNNPYYLSKTLAEQKAWELAGSQTQWKLVVINPSLVFGPGLKYHPESESFRLVRKMASGIFVLGAPAMAIPAVDVREVSAAHMAAAFSPDAAGRYIVSAHNSTAADIGMALAERYYPQYPLPTRILCIPKMLLWLVAPYIERDLTRAIVAKNVNRRILFDNTKSRRELGIHYRPLEETVQEMFQQIIDAKAVEINRFYLF